MKKIKPFIRWAGGKTSLLPEIAKRFPPRVETYWEPFLGSGAVFFALHDRIGKAILSDRNDELITTFKVVRDDLPKLLPWLEIHAEGHAHVDKYYYMVRAQAEVDPVKKAARFIYLNKTCFNGLYRVNNDGKFNVAKGTRKIFEFDEGELIAANSVLQAKASLLSMWFSSAVNPCKGDFIYCDPPYDGTFTKYQPRGFDSDSQRTLQFEIKRWVEKGATVLLSNSDTPLIRELYEEIGDIETVSAPRRINSNPDGRKSVDELLITIKP